MHKKLISPASRLKALIAALLATTLGLFGSLTATPLVASAVDAPYFTVIDADTEGQLYLLQGEAGSALSKNYRIEFSAGWDFSGAWSRQFFIANEEISYSDITLTGDVDAGYSATFSVTGTPTYGFYRDQALEISDGVNSYRYEYDIAITASETIYQEYNAEYFTYGSPVLPSGRTQLFRSLQLTVIGDDAVRYPLNPTSDVWDHAKTVKIDPINNQVDFEYDIYVYTSDTRGDIHAQVLISLQEDRYYLEVNTYSYSEEGNPVEHVVEFEVDFVSGPNTVYTMDDGNRLFVEDSENFKPAAMIRPNTITEYSFAYESGNVVATTDGTASMNFFRLYFYDYEGCPAENELFTLYDAGDLLTVGNQFDDCPPFALDLENLEGQWFSMDWREFPSLYHVNKSSGALNRIAIATESFTNRGNAAGVEVDSDSAKAYFITYGYRDQEGETLWEIDLATGTFTALTKLVGIQNITALDLRPNGDLWFSADYRDGENTKPIGYVTLDTLEVVVVSENTQYPAEANVDPGETIRFAALATSPSGAFYGIDYYRKLFKFNGTSWQFLRDLSDQVEIYAADFDVNGLLIYQGWRGDVNSIDIDSLAINPLWDSYTFSSPYQGEAIAVATGVDFSVQQDNFGIEGGNTNSGSTPPPMSIDPITAPVKNGISGFNAGNVVNATGKGLDGISKLTIGGVAATFSNNTATGFTFTIPAGLAPGIYDLVLTATNGTLSYQRAVLIAGKDGVIVVEGNTQNFKKTFIGYAAGRSVLTKAMKTQIREWLDQHPRSGVTIGITGYTMGPRVLTTDRKLALARGKAAIAYIKSIRPDVQFTPVKSQTQTRVGAQHRSVQIELTYSK